MVSKNQKGRLIEFMFNNKDLAEIASHLQGETVKMGNDLPGLLVMEFSERRRIYDETAYLQGKGHDGWCVLPYAQAAIKSANRIAKENGCSKFKKAENRNYLSQGPTLLMMKGDNARNRQVHAIRVHGGGSAYDVDKTARGPLRDAATFMRTDAYWLSNKVAYSYMSLMAGTKAETVKTYKNRIVEEDVILMEEFFSGFLNKTPRGFRRRLRERCLRQAPESIKKLI